MKHSAIVFLALLASAVAHAQEVVSPDGRLNVPKNGAAVIVN